MVDYKYPTNAELTEIQQELVPELIAGDPAFEILPFEESDSANLNWEQEGDYVGTMQVRGIGGKPSLVNAIGGRRFSMTPGYYGEFQTIDEQELTERRRYGTFNVPIEIDDLVMRRFRHLQGRRIAAIKAMIWSLISTGRFATAKSSNALNPDVTITHTDQFSIQRYTASTPWSTVASATPLKDMRAMALLSRGKSVTLGAGAKAYCNRGTLNNLLNNTNSSDIGGKRVEGGNTYNDLAAFNRTLVANDLPSIQVVEGGYKDESGNWNLYVPDNTVIVVGKRLDGADVGKFRLTRNVNNDDMSPGFYDKVIDKGATQVPRLIEVHAGFNGGPVIYFPSAIVAMSV